MKTMTSRTLVAGTIVLSAIGLSACSGSSGGGTAASTDAAATTAAAAATTDAMASGMVGSGCAGYAAQVPTGAGSVAGMAQDPVATAAGNNPLLTTLTAAVSGKLNPKVDLVDTLNGGQFTVFAPVDDAFKKLPTTTVDALKKDDKTLTKILTYHVVAGRLAPGDVDGMHATVEGGSVDVTGAGNDIKVNGASVICGGVKTANATVYLIDTVLSPPKS
jgi:uncharacterized surface protein with fasciclin (FAS1) repeats